MGLISIPERLEGSSISLEETRLRNLQNVIVKEAIVHILEPKEGKKTISERNIPLRNNPALSEYFAEHIKLSSNDPMARSARFLKRKPDETSGICHEMFRDSSRFISGSQQLAELLFDAMGQDQRVSDGDLVVCRYSVGAAQDQEYLAIIKLDPVGAFRNVEMEDPGTGKKYIDLQIDPFVFPRTTDILQKGAYIGASPQNEHYDLLLLDKQLKGAEVAQFFYADFLGVDFVQDPAELTLRLYKCLIAALNSLRPSLTSAEDHTLGTAIYMIFTQQSMFDIYQWVNNLAVSQNVISELTHMLREDLPEIMVIPLDLTLVKAYINRRTFSGQMGLRFSIPTVGYETTVKSVTRMKKPGMRDYYQVVIYTATWNEEA